MEFKLTSKYQKSKKCKDGKYRNFVLYFVNGILILRQKLPFDTSYSIDSDLRTWIRNEYLLNGNLYQERIHIEDSEKGNPSRHVRYPISKKLLNELGIPENFKVEISS
jgi:hypothetical protein